MLQVNKTRRLVLLLSLVGLIGFVCAFAVCTLTRNESLAWVTIILGSCLAWPIGLRFGRWVGARYVVAWCFAWIGAAVSFLALVCFLEAKEQDLEQLLRELRGGTFPGSVFIGALVALGVSFVLTIIDIGIATNKRGPSTPTNAKSPWQFTIRTLLVVMVVASLVGSAFQAAWAPLLRCSRSHQRVTVAVDSLHGRCPPNVSKQEWDNFIDWTHNAVGNCLTSPCYIRDETRLHRFADELEQKLRGNVDVSTIDWIWDEIEKISTHGEYYSKKYRPTRR